MMSRSILTSMCRRCQTRFLTTNPPTARTLTSTASKPQPQPQKQKQGIELFEDAFRKPGTGSSSNPTIPRGTPSSNNNNKLDSIAQGALNEAATRPSSAVSDNEPYHLTVYAHKHNMHITFTEPSRDPILSFSIGNIGLRGAQRGTFDAAYQLTTYTMRKMAEKQWRTGGKGMTTNKMMTLNEPEVKERGIEVVLRGYGPGREAFTKALCGTEGRIIKPLVRRVTDSTRLKFGGCRSRAVRRLG